jgi:hypothetical protein
MELVVGPFDPALHVRSRDHYEAVRREAQLLDLQSDAAPRRLDELSQRHLTRLVDAQVDPVVDAAFLARRPSFATRLVVPDEQVPALLADCTELERLLEELDRWAHDAELAILEPSRDVKEYRLAFLAQLRAQLDPAHVRHDGSPGRAGTATAG